MKKTNLLLGVLFLFLVLNNLLFAAGEAPLLFDVKSDKLIKNIYLIGEDEDYILITNKANIFVYNANTGKLVWQDKVPNFTEEGLELIWNATRYIVSMKKGMRCYDVATGKVLWETKTEFKMASYWGYNNFKTGFVLGFGNVLMGFNPDNGEFKWQSEGLDWNTDITKEGGTNYWSLEREFGGRLLILGNKVTQLLDASNGKLLGTVSIEYNPKNPEPVSFIGDNAVALFGKDWTKAMDLRDGKELWAVDEEVDVKRGYRTFESNGAHYALFSFKKCMSLYNLNTGQKLWDTTEDLAVNIDDMHLYDNGVLLAVGTKNRLSPASKVGTCAWAVGLDLATGKMKYKTLIGQSSVTSQRAKILFITVNNQSAIVHTNFDYPNGVLFYFFGMKTRVVGADGEGGEKGPGEGIVLMDPATGVVKYRTNITLYDNWEDDLGKAADRDLQKQTHFPGTYDDNDEIPPFIIQGDYGYINANNTIVKVELSTGKTIWSGPELGFVSNFQVDKGRVFGEIGYSRWTYEYDLGGPKANDKIYKSKRNGYFVLDEANGKEIWKVNDLKTPVELFMDEYLPEKDLVYLCDGQNLRCLDLNKGGYKWEIDMKKGLTGILTADEGVAFVLLAVSRSFSSGVDYWSMTTTKTYNISWEHGVFIQPGGDLLVMAAGGPALVSPEGKIKWRGEWDWNPKKINYVPHVTEKGIVYQYKKSLRYISLADGNLLWEAKVEKATDADIFLDTNSHRIFVIEEGKYLSAYKL